MRDSFYNIHILFCTSETVEVNKKYVYMKLVKTLWEPQVWHKCRGNKAYVPLLSNIIVGQNDNMNIANIFFENLANLGTPLTNQECMFEEMKSRSIQFSLEFPFFLFAVYKFEY
jgi:hypothetical protein